MAKDTTKDPFRGLGPILPTSLTGDALWAAESSYDQAGPLAGVPEDQDGSSLVLKATGTQTAASALRYRGLIGGFPGHGYTAGTGWPCTGIWQRSGDADWYGWDAPVMINGYEVVQERTAPSDRDAHRKMAIMTLASGNVLAVGNGDSGSTVRLSSRLYTASTNTWETAVLIKAIQLSSGDIPDMLADVVQLPTGRVLCIYLTQDDLEPGEANIGVQYSDDEGTTWTSLAELTIGAGNASGFSATTETFRRLRAEFNPATGEILVVVWSTATSGTFTDRAWQFASRDLGANFELVTTIGGVSDDDQSLTGDVLVVGGVFLWLSDNPTATPALKGTHAIRIGSAYDVLTAGSTETAFNTQNADIPTTVGENRIAACVDDRGVVWVFTGNIDPTVDNSMVSFSGDGGLSWNNAMGGSENSGYGSWFQPGVSGVYPIQMACTWQRGRIIMLSNHTSPTTSTDDQTLAAIYLGGFTTVTLPYRKTQLSTVLRGRRNPSVQVGWERNYLPYELPANDGWVKAGSGTSTEAITLGLLVLTTTGTGTVRYEKTFTGISAGDPAISRGTVEARTGEALGLMSIDDGTTEYRSYVKISSTAIALWDSGSASQLATANHGGGVVEWIHETAGSSARVWWRDRDSSEERGWSELSGTMTSFGVADGTSIIFFGSSFNTTSDCDFYEFSFSQGDRAGAGLDGFTNPADLQGLPLGAGPEAAEYIADGVSIYAVDGPLVPEENWHIDTRYEYPIERIFPGTSPSPAVGWRSSTTTATMAIAWRRSTGFTSRAWNGPEVLHLRGINFRQFQLQRTQNNGSTWTDEVTFENNRSTVFTRVGNIVYPGSGSPVDSPYYKFNELAGCYFKFPNNTVRKITANTEGNWILGSTDVAKCALYLEDIDDTEDASGTGEIWFSNVTLLFSPYNADALRIQINDDAGTAPPEGYFTIGSMLHGRIMPFGKDYSFGRNLTRTPNTEITTNRDGTRRSRVNSKSRRAVAVTFAPSDITPYSSDGQPDSIEWNATFSINIAADEPVKIPGLMDYLRGPDRLLLYLPHLPKFSGADGNVQILGDSGIIYGRMTSSVTRNSLRGTEEVDESMNVVQLVIEEEL